MSEGEAMMWAISIPCTALAVVLFIVAIAQGFSPWGRAYFVDRPDCKNCGWPHARKEEHKNNPEVFRVWCCNCKDILEESPAPAEGERDSV